MRYVPVLVASGLVAVMLLLGTTLAPPIFGKDSEWFWVMAQFSALAVTFVAIYLQLREQRASNAVTQVFSLADRWNSPRMVHRRLTVATHFRDHKDDLPPEGAEIGSFFEQLASFEEHGHLPRRTLWEMFGDPVQFWWALFGSRVTASNPSVYGGFRRLAKLMHDMDRERKALTLWDEAAVAQRLGATVAGNIATLRMIHEIETGEIPGDPDGSRRRELSSGADCRRGRRMIHRFLRA